MGSDFLTADQARATVEQYIANEGLTSSTQDIIDSGAVPRLNGYVVKPGKVSDSIFGGPVSFTTKTGERVEAENPPLLGLDGNPVRIMVRTDRISTHDINRGNIPFKDQVLATNHDFMRRFLAPVFGTSQYETSLPDTAVVIAAENLKQIAFENVVRAYMAKSTTSTSLYVHYMRGAREFCGHALPEGLVANGVLPYVMDTPSTKSDEHDESVSPQWLFDNGICTPAQYMLIRDSSLRAFDMVAGLLRTRGLIAVDTKTEHGINSSGKIVSQDEIWTMDSSRFWNAADYQQQLARLESGEITELNPRSLSKEFARGFSEGDKGYTDDQRIQIAMRYIEGIQNLLNKPFNPDVRPRDVRVATGLEAVVNAVCFTN